MKAYIEIEKQIARKEALSLAVKYLTKNRQSSTIARKGYVREIKDYLVKNGTPDDRDLASSLAEKEILQWESFYESIIGKKKPSDLRVAYLSGPNPENDLEILVNNGILAENIWAFESDKRTYTEAVVSALNSKFPFVKIYKARIEKYLKLLPFKFDIIYLDMCGTIASTNTISVVRDVFLHQKLSSPGILITNFALPEKSKSNREVREDLNLLAANYLFPKSYTEEYTGLGGGWKESASILGLDCEEFLKIAKRNETTFYSQFITRVLFDLPSVIIPYQRLTLDSSLSELFFKKFDHSTINKDYYEDLIGSPDINPLYCGLSYMLSLLIEKESYHTRLDKFKKQLSIHSNKDQLMNSIMLVRSFITGDFEKNIHSDKLEKIRKNWEPLEKYIFCDVFMFHQLKEILVGQLTNPYYYNVERTNRWTYKAKKTEMYMDLVTYDECRYIFDWMPTIDMIEAGVSDVNRQLSLRFAMDSISKQSRWYNNEFFYGTAVVDERVKNFESKKLKKRKRIR